MNQEITKWLSALGRGSAALAVVATLALSGAASAQSVTLATGDEYPPYSDRKLPDGGLATKLVQDVFADMGVKLELTWLPWARQFDQAKAGDLLGTFPWSDKDDRRNFFHYSDALFELKEVAWVLKDSAMVATKPDDFKGKKLCLPLGYGMASSLKPLVDSADIKVETPSDMATCFKLLQASRVEAVIASAVQGEATAKDVLGSVEAAKALDFGQESAHLYLLLSKARPESADLMAKFNASLKKVQGKP